MVRTRKVALVLRNIFIASTLFVAMISVAQDNSKVPSEVVGTWVIQGAYQTRNITAISASEMKELRGAKIVITRNNLESCGQSVKITGVETQALTDEQLFDGIYVTFKELDVHSPTLTEVMLRHPGLGSCMGKFDIPGEDLYIKGNNELIVEWGRAFFRAVRLSSRHH